MRHLLLLLLFVLFSNIGFSQDFHIFKGPTNNEGTMIVLLQENGNNAYFYEVISTDYYSDMREMTESGWKEFMHENKSDASSLQKTGNNTYTGKYIDRITWNLRFTYDKYDKTAKTVFTHPDYESNVFDLVEVGFDGYQLAKQKRPESSTSKGNCWVCNGRGIIDMSFPFTGHMTCTNCGGTGIVNFNSSNSNTNSYSSGGGSTYGGGTSGNSSHQCRVCNGTGSEIYEPYTGSGREVYCDICKKTFYHAHSHRTCKTCGGSGRISN